MERPTLSQTKLVTKVVFTPEKFSEIEPYQSLWFVLCGAHSGGTPECPVPWCSTNAGPPGPLGMTRKEDSSRLFRHEFTVADRAAQAESLAAAGRRVVRVGS